MDMLQSKHAFVLLGNDKTGKTSFQKDLIEILCGVEKERLDANLVFRITHPSAPLKFETISFMNRSYQEKKRVYGDVDAFFSVHFKDADVVVLSSHLNGCRGDIESMIQNCRSRNYNVSAVFWSNCSAPDDIKFLAWDERFLMHNPVHVEPVPASKIEEQIRRAAEQFGNMLISRSHSW